MKKQKGITLIALVITIVVMLILAGVTINVVTGDNGIINKARESEKNYEMSVQKKEILEEILTKEMEKSALNGRITRSEIIEILEGYGEVTYDGEDIKGIKLNKYPKDEILLSDIWKGNYLKGVLAELVKLGDYVEYVPDVVPAYTLLSMYSGTASNQNIAADITLEWRVLDVVNGEIRLIGVGDEPNGMVQFKGKDGYNNAVYELDAICEKLYSKENFSVNSQNLKIEDLEKHIKYDPKTYINTFGYQYGVGTEEYGNEVTRYYPNILANEKDAWINGGSEGEWGRSRQDNNVTGETEVTDKIKVTQTLWGTALQKSDFINEAHYDMMLAKDGDGHWISSRGNGLDPSRVSFGIYKIGQYGFAGIENLYYSNGQVMGLPYKHRPVVTLKSTIKPDGQTAEGAWKIKQ